MATDNQIQYSGEYKLEKLELITLNCNIDLVNNYVQIDLFESIFKNSITFMSFKYQFIYIYCLF